MTPRVRASIMGLTPHARQRPNIGTPSALLLPLLPPGNLLAAAPSPRPVSSRRRPPHLSPQHDDRAADRRRARPSCAQRGTDMMTTRLNAPTPTRGNHPSHGPTDTRYAPGISLSR